MHLVLDLVADWANNNGRVYFSMLRNQPQHILYEIWDKILCYEISQSGCSWPNHKYRVFTRIRSVSSQFYQLMETLKMILPTIYISDSTWFYQQLGNRAVGKQRLIKRFDAHSGIILELKRIIASSKWDSAWAVLVLDVFGCFFVSKIFWRNSTW